MINIEHGKERPENVFKFFSLNEQNVNSLINSYLYAAHPHDLNDYLDSSPFFLYVTKPLDYEFYENFFGFLYKDKNELKKFYEHDISQTQLCKEYISQYWQTSTNILGIISTTAKENNPLMWPHYTNEKGFQVKFNVEKLENSIKQQNKPSEYLGFYPMNYSPKLVPIDISQFDLMFIPLFYIATLKSDAWKYEDEWRFLISKPQMGVPYSKSGLVNQKDYFVKKENRFIYYDNELVEEICLGMNFFTGREFEIKWLNEKQFSVSIKDDNFNKDNHELLLTHIANSKLKNKLYYSGVKYELDEDEQLFLIRTKEKLEIEQVNNEYIITRKDEIIKIF
jgi:hypothetical protein